MKQEKIKKQRKSKEEKLLDKYKDDYRVETCKYKTGEKTELWRKNKRYGYYNFVSYLDSCDEEIVNKAIIDDVNNQAKLAKEKKLKKSEQSDINW